MAKISQLEQYINPQDNDLTVIVDVNNSKTKKITWSSIKNALKSYFDVIYDPIITDFNNHKNSISGIHGVSGNVVGTSDAQVLTNKRIQKRVYSTSTSITSITPDISQYDVYQINSLSNNLTIYNPIGNPTLGDTITILIRDNGTSRSLIWGNFYVGMGQPLPSSTTAGKIMEFTIRYYYNYWLVSYVVQY